MRHSNTLAVLLGVVFVNVRSHNLFFRNLSQQQVANNGVSVKQLAIRERFFSNFERFQCYLFSAVKQRSFDRVFELV